MEGKKKIKEEDLGTLSGGCGKKIEPKKVCGVKTDWAPCGKYKPARGKEYRLKLCGNCIYCDKFDPGDFILSEDATCHYPVAVH